MFNVYILERLILGRGIFVQPASEARGYCCGFFLVVRVHESRSTSSEGDPQLGKFVLSRQVNLNTPGLSKALLAICFMSVLSVCEPSIEGKISKILT